MTVFSLLSALVSMLVKSVKQKKRLKTDAQRLVTEVIENALHSIAFGDKQKKKHKSWLARIKNYACFFFQFRKKEKGES